MITHYSMHAALKVTIKVICSGPPCDPPNYRTGSSVTLQCMVEGASGSVSYYWTTTCTSSCFMSDGYTGSTLQDNFLRYYDAGNYTCTVTDEIGNTGQDKVVMNINGRYNNCDFSLCSSNMQFTQVCACLDKSNIVKNDSDTKLWGPLIDSILFIVTEDYHKFQLINRAACEMCLALPNTVSLK